MPNHAAVPFSPSPRSASPLSLEPSGPSHRSGFGELPLLQAAALRRAIFNSEMFCKIATDVDGLIQIFNVGAQRMLGYSAEDVMGRWTPADLADPRELGSRALSMSLELGTTIELGFESLVCKAARGLEDIYELTCIRKDGSRLPALFSVTALRDDDNRIIGYLWIGTDNTARKHAELARVALHGELERAKLVAENANRAKSDFLSGMSHELRSPLHAILGFAQLIETGVPQPTAEQTESVGQILKAGWYLLDLINEILDLSLIESGMMSLSPESVSLAEVLQECESMIEPQAQRAEIGIEFLQLDCPSFVRADRTRLKQVIVNLLSNAIKYNRSGGTVRIDCSSPSPQRTRISFTDTGHGLSPAKLAHLFEPFNRLGQETGAEEGTGIGLLVSKRLMEVMGGEIGASSTEGLGSVFWIELDAVASPDLSVSDIPSAPIYDGSASTGHFDVLCVEDNPANLMLIERLLSRRPAFRMSSAPDGVGGVAKAKAARPDVILMDVNLPGISGIETLRRLLSDSDTASIPVIALSANAMPRDVRKGLEAGFFRYLTKPIRVDELMETLDLALESVATTTSSADRT